jgi:hypothetical protein
MSKVQKMTIDAIKQQVMRIEGFELFVDGGPRKLIETCLRPNRQSSDETTVSDWLTQNFPSSGKNDVAVLLSSGKMAKRLTLKKVRASYPEDFRKLARVKKKAETKAEEAKTALKASQKKARLAQREVIKTVQEINVARKDGENEAGYDALDKALRNPGRYHERVIELCNKAIGNGHLETQNLMEFLLAAWTHAEKERDRLEQLAA